MAIFAVALAVFRVLKKDGGDKIAPYWALKNEYGARRSAPDERLRQS